MSEQAEIDGRCLTCGFLGVRQELTGGIAAAPDDELPTESRCAGNSSQTLNRGGFTRSSELICIRRAADLERERVEDLGASNSGVERKASVLRVLSKERSCPIWTEHIEGLSPGEHIVQMRSAELVAKQKEWDRQREIREREFKAQMEARRAKSEREFRQYSKRSNRQFLVVAACGVFFTAAQLFMMLEAAGTIDWLPNVGPGRWTERWAWRWWRMRGRVRRSERTSPMPRCSSTR